jgi:hypothetical protein
MVHGDMKVADRNVSVVGVHTLLCGVENPIGQVCFAVTQELTQFLVLDS